MMFTLEIIALDYSHAATRGPVDEHNALGIAERILNIREDGSVEALMVAVEDDYSAVALVVIARDDRHAYRPNRKGAPGTGAGMVHNLTVDEAQALFDGPRTARVA